MTEDLKTVSPELRRRVEDNLTMYIQRAEQALGVTINRPTVIYTKRGKVAGTASRSNVINLNPVLFNQNIAETLTDTLGHELAHIICFQHYPKVKAHGATFKRMCNIIGVSDSTTHRMDTSTARVSRITDDMMIPYKCGCGVVRKWSLRKHNNNVAHVVKYRARSVPLESKWQCKTCKQPIVPAKPEWMCKLRPENFGVVPKYRQIAKKPRATNDDGTPTKLQQAYGIYEGYVNDGRNAVIVQIMDQLNMSYAGASTYYYKAKAYHENPPI